MRLIIFGKPASGKGTQAKQLATHFSIAHLSTGDMLRDLIASGTPEGLAIKALLDKGQFASDAQVIDMINTRLSQPDCANGFILDGFPRTTPQAIALDLLLEKRQETIDATLMLNVDTDVAVARMLARQAVEGRSDDTPEAFKARLAVFDKKTKPVLDHYPSLLHINANQDVDGVFASILTALG